MPFHGPDVDAARCLRPAPPCDVLLIEQEQEEERELQQQKKPATDASRETIANPGSSLGRHELLRSRLEDSCYRALLAGPSSGLTTWW